MARKKTKKTKKVSKKKRDQRFDFVLKEKVADKYVDVKEAAKILKKDPGTVRLWVRQGELVATLKGNGRGKYFIKKAALKAFRKNYNK